MIRILIGGLLVALPLAFGYKYYRKRELQSTVVKIGQCVTAGGCFDAKTLTCGPYVRDATKACGMPPSEVK